MKIIERHTDGSIRVRMNDSEVHLLLHLFLKNMPLLESSNDVSITCDLIKKLVEVICEAEGRYVE